MREKMNSLRTMVPAAAALALSVLAAVGVRTFLGPCVHEDGSFGACHWAGRALIGQALLLAAQSLAALLCRASGTRRGLYFAMALTALLGIFLPGTLIGLCRMDTMRCRALMQPAMIILNAGAGLASLAGWLSERRRTVGIKDEFA